MPPRFQRLRVVPCPIGCSFSRPGRFQGGTGAARTPAIQFPWLHRHGRTTVPSTSPWITTIRSNFPPRTDNRPRLRGGSRSLKHAPMECGAGSSGRRRAGPMSRPASTAMCLPSTTTIRAASSSRSSPWPSPTSPI